MMGNHVNELARLFKERDNQKQIGIMVGTVVSSTPLSVSIGSITLSGDRLLVASRLVDRTEELDIRNIDGGSGGIYSKYEFKYQDVLKPGDRVIVNPTEDRQTFIILDKLIRG